MNKETKTTEPQHEYEVLFRAANGSTLSAYVYADSEHEAKQQAQRQRIDRNKIKSVKYIGKRRDYGHI